MDTCKRILLVENDADQADIILTAIDEHRLADRVVVARDGEEALDYLHRREAFKLRREGNPAVVLLERWLPKMDGLGLLRQIRSDQRLKLIPVVMLSPASARNDLIASYQAGVNAFVVKPADFHEFFETVMVLSLFWGVINQPPPGAVETFATTRGRFNAKSSEISELRISNS